MAELFHSEKGGAVMHDITSKAFTFTKHISANKF